MISTPLLPGCIVEAAQMGAGECTVTSVGVKSFTVDAFPDFKILYKMNNGVPITLERLKEAGFSTASFQEGYCGIIVRTNMLVMFTLNIQDGKFAFKFKMDGLPFEKRFEFFHELQVFFEVMTGTKLIIKTKG